MIVWQMSSGKSPFAKDNHKGDASDAFNIILKAAVEHSRPEMVRAKKKIKIKILKKNSLSPIPNRFLYVHLHCAI